MEDREERQIWFEASICLVSVRARAYARYQTPAWEQERWKLELCFLGSYNLIRNTKIKLIITKIN